MNKLQWILFLNFIIIQGCNELSSTARRTIAARKEEEVILCSPGTGKAVDKYGHPIPDSISELHIIANGFKIVPLMELRSLTAFLPHTDSAMVLGDIIISRSDLPWVHTELEAHGLKIADVHQYPARDGSVILFMHISGFGDPGTLTEAVKSLFAKLKEIEHKSFKVQKLNSPMMNINRLRIDSIIGYEAEVKGDFYNYNIERVELFKKTAVPGSGFGFNTWATWQGTEEKAVVAGDFIMLEDEVGPVIQALAENGLEPVYTKLVHEEPGIYCLHYWGTGKAENLAKGIKAALEQQEKNLR
jgi:hypothetical protein